MRRTSWPAAREEKEEWVKRTYTAYNVLLTFLSFPPMRRRRLSDLATRSDCAGSGRWLVAHVPRARSSEPPRGADAGQEIHPRKAANALPQSDPRDGARLLDTPGCPRSERGIRGTERV